MNTYRKTTRKFLRVVPSFAFRRMDHKINREKKQTKTLRRMRPERED